MEQNTVIEENLISEESKQPVKSKLHQFVVKYFSWMKGFPPYDFAMAHFEVLEQFFKFGIIGLMNTFIAYGINNGLYLYFDRSRILGDSITVMTQTANLVAFFITVFIGYYLNSRFTFQADPSIPWWKSMIKVYLSYSITGIFMNAILIYIQVNLLGFPYYIATFVNLFFTVPTNFFLNKFWAYK